MASERKLKIRYANFHRFWSGLIVISFIITVLASALAGARTTTITYRSVAVILILGVIGRIIIRSWASWEEMRRSENETGRR